MKDRSDEHSHHERMLYNGAIFIKGYMVTWYQTVSNHLNQTYMHTYKHAYIHAYIHTSFNEFGDFVMLTDKLNTF